MTHNANIDDLARLVEGIDDTVNAHPKSPEMVCSSELLDSGRSGLSPQSGDGVEDSGSRG